MFLQNWFEKVDNLFFQRILDYVRIKIGRDRFDLAKIFLIFSCLVCMLRWSCSLFNDSEMHVSILGNTIGLFVIFVATGVGCIYVNLLKSAHRHAVMSLLPGLRQSMTMAILILLFIRVFFILIDLNNADLSFEIIFDGILSVVMWVSMLFAINLLACNFFGRSEFDLV